MNPEIEPASRHQVGKDDLYLFGEGTHRRLHDVLGAQLVPGGVRFAVWAPNARAVQVVGSFASGGHAERFALHHARFKAQAGVASEVRVFLRDGSLAARLCFPARDGLPLAS